MDQQVYLTAIHSLESLIESELKDHPILQEQASALKELLVLEAVIVRNTSITYTRSGDFINDKANIENYITQKIIQNRKIFEDSLECSQEEQDCLISYFKMKSNEMKEQQKIKKSSIEIKLNLETLKKHFNGLPQLQMLAQGLQDLLLKLEHNQISYNEAKESRVQLETNINKVIKESSLLVAAKEIPYLPFSVEARRQYLAILFHVEVSDQQSLKLAEINETFLKQTEKWKKSITGSILLVAAGEKVRADVDARIALLEPLQAAIALYRTNKHKGNPKTVVSEQAMVLQPLAASSPLQQPCLSNSGGAEVPQSAVIEAKETLEGGEGIEALKSIDVEAICTQIAHLNSRQKSCSKLQEELIAMHLQKIEKFSLKIEQDKLNLECMQRDQENLQRTQDDLLIAEVISHLEPVVDSYKKCFAVINQELTHVSSLQQLAVIAQKMENIGPGINTLEKKLASLNEKLQSIFANNKLLAHLTSQLTQIKLHANNIFLHYLLKESMLKITDFNQNLTQAFSFQEFNEVNMQIHKTVAEINRLKQKIQSLQEKPELYVAQQQLQIDFAAEMAQLTQEKNQLLRRAFFKEFTFKITQYFKAREAYYWFRDALSSVVAFLFGWLGYQTEKTKRQRYAQSTTAILQRYAEAKDEYAVAIPANELTNAFADGIKNYRPRAKEGSAGYLFSLNHLLKEEQQEFANLESARLQR